MLNRVKEMTGETPPALASQPVLSEHLKYYLKLFQELAEDSRKYSGMGEPRPLLLRDFLDYANLWQFSRLETQESWEIVRVIDSLWLGLYAKRQKAEPKKVGKKVGKKP